MTPRPNSTGSTLVERLYVIAEGSAPAEAAVMILTEAVNGRLVDTAAAFIADYPEKGHAFVDWEAVAAGVGPLSGGERRLLAVAMSLASPVVTVNLNDALCGLDHGNGETVAGAVAHALGVGKWGAR